MRWMRPWRERMQTLKYTYWAVATGLGVSLLMGSVHWDTLNFWLTSGLAFLIVTCFDLFVLALVDERTVTPSRFLCRMMLIVVALQAAFAGIYYLAATETTYLARGGARITEFADALYFSGVTLLTVGYGDVVPVGDFRFTAVAEVYGGTLFIFAFFSWGLSIIASRHSPRGR